MPDPQAAYSRRAAAAKAAHDRFAARWGQVANWRLAAFAAALACVGLAWWRGLPALGWGAGGLLLVFLGLVALHNRLAGQRRRSAALLELGQEGLARLRRDWAALPLRAPAAPPADPTTARDLDLLGHASLQHLLNTPRSPAGQAAIQAWITAPAPPATVAGRQAAVAELAPLIDLREEVALLAAQAGEAQARYERFTAWAAGAPWLLARPALLWLCRLAPAALLAGLAAQVAGLTPLPLWALPLLLNIALTGLFSRRTQATLEQLIDRQELLAAYAELFGQLGAAPLRAPALAQIQARLGQGPEAAARRLRQLSLIAAAAELSRSLLFPALQFGLLWSFHVTALAEGWRRRSGARLADWLAALGDFEALAALAALRFEQPAWCEPDLAAAHPPLLSARGLGHPLIPDDRRVVNDLTIGPPGRVLLITGSNMSGKSTLLRAVGLNVALAQAGGPACAAALQLPPTQLATSMRVQDSLEQGVSYFMAELRRLRTLVAQAEAARAGGPLVCFLLDEILHGTNSGERLVAARRVIRHLIALGAIGAVSTHDLALAEDPRLAPLADLAHFSEQLELGPAGEEMRFDYRLRPGLATSTNALRLMELVGLPAED